MLEPWNFRTSLRATVVDARAALRRARSNEGIPVPGCLVVHPLLAELLDGRRYPGAEEVLLRCEARTGERLVSVRPRRIVADVPGDVRSDWVHELAAGRTWRLSAGSFFQSRPDGVDALADLVVAAASDVEPTVAVDLYSGVGVFAGVLAARGWSVTAVEGSDRAVRRCRGQPGRPRGPGSAGRRDQMAPRAGGPGRGRPQPGWTGEPGRLGSDGDGSGPSRIDQLRCGQPGKGRIPSLIRRLLADLRYSRRPVPPHLSHRSGECLRPELIGPDRPRAEGRSPASPSMTPRRAATVKRRGLSLAIKTWGRRLIFFQLMVRWSIGSELGGRAGSSSRSNTRP